ncbi:MAG TPA: DUF433 domain-containing protein [Pyrinomonadaceae bacterium]|nr:DUF433 domain-containing protein [Pyrinomonadaceae bacterium]
MNTIFSEKGVDERVIAEAEDDSAWDEPIFVKRQRPFFLSTVGPSEIERSDDILNGNAVFRGTRVPVSTMIENLEAGVSLNEFLDNFPTVKREQAIQILEFFKNSLTQLKAA